MADIKTNLKAKKRKKQLGMLKFTTQISQKNMLEFSSLLSTLAPYSNKRTLQHKINNKIQKPG